jgi:hypothetical protein
MLIFAVPSIVILTLVGFPQLNNKYRLEGSSYLLLVYGLLAGVNAAVFILSIAGLIMSVNRPKSENKNTLKAQFASLSGIGYCVRVNFISVPFYWFPVCVFRMIKRISIIRKQNISTNL